MGLFDRLVNGREKTAADQQAAVRLLVANWKCHKKTADARRWLEAFAAEYRPRPELRVVIAAPFLSLESLAEYLRELRLDHVYLAAQDCSSYPKGSYTGAIAADMLTGLVEYVIIGHAERRRYFHETATDVVNKVHEAADAGLKPIVCLELAEAAALLPAIKDCDCPLTLAYCPVEALQFRIAESPEKVRTAVQQLQKHEPRAAIIYGGAVHPDTASAYLQLPELTGVFIGEASLEVSSFLQIVATA